MNSLSYPTLRSLQSSIFTATVNFKSSVCLLRRVFASSLRLSQQTDQSHSLHSLS